MVHFQGHFQRVEKLKIEYYISTVKYNCGKSKSQGD